jgi:hypothetical protein
MKPKSDAVEQPRRKRRIHWRRWFFLLLLLALAWLYYHFPKGSGWAGTLGNMFTSEKPAPVTPKESMTSVKLRLSFSPAQDTVYLGNWQCASKPLQKNLREIVPQIRRQYPQQQIIIVYEENKGDAYFLIKDVEHILKENGFLFDWKNKNE